MPMPPGQNKPAELIRSPAAQQLLWAWVENARYEGPVTTSSDLRTTFLAELEGFGWFPSRPRKLGIANGAPDGARRDALPDELVFDWVEKHNLAACQARIQPDSGDHENVGRMRLLFDYLSGFTSDVPAMDSAPGGTLDAYDQIAKPLGIELDPRHRQTCFVPTVSAIALKGDPVGWPTELLTDVSALPPGATHLDAYFCNPTNSIHSEVTPEIADWLLAQLTPVAATR